MISGISVRNMPRRFHCSLSFACTAPSIRLSTVRQSEWHRRAVPLGPLC
jgi:hypothetical protein